MKYNLTGTVECDTRKDQLKLLWGCLVGFFKKLPVEVYDGYIVLYDDADLIKDQLYITYSLPPGTLENDDDV